MLCAWREAKISGHCLKPVFFFPVNDENWLTETHSYHACRWIHFFNGHLMCTELQFFKEKGGKKLSCFSFPVYHYLWTQHQCRQSSINYAWNFLGSLVFFLTEERKRKMLSRWRTRKINDQIDHCSGLAERILGIKVTNLAGRTLLFLNINWVIFYFLLFSSILKSFFLFFEMKNDHKLCFCVHNISFSIHNMANHLFFIVTWLILNKFY